MGDAGLDLLLRLQAPLVIRPPRLGSCGRRVLPTVGFPGYHASGLALFRALGRFDYWTGDSSGSQALVLVGLLLSLNKGAQRIWRQAKLGAIRGVTDTEIPYRGPAGVTPTRSRRKRSERSRPDSGWSAEAPRIAVEHATLPTRGRCAAWVRFPANAAMRGVTGLRWLSAGTRPTI